MPSADLSGATPARRDARAELATGAVAGALAGALVGAGDTAWGWRAAGQFLAGLGEKLALGLHVGAGYALLGAVLGTCGAAALLVLSRGTRLGDLGRAMRTAHREQRLRDPARAVTFLALVLAGVPALAAAGVLAHRLSVPLLARRHPELVALSILLLGLGALLAAGLVTLLAGRALEAPLAALARRRALGRALTSPLAPPICAVILTGTGLAALAATHWATARLLPLRPPLVATLWAVLALAAAPLARRALARVTGRARLLWPLAAVLAIGTFARCGGDAGVQKAARAHTALGGSLASAVRRAIDRDGDGFSPVLAGGDCDDGDARIHPGATELIGDGIDQNCLAGDAHAAAAHDLRWHREPLPVPPDANLLLITLDTVRADHLSAYGYPRATTPAIDRVAAEGTLFLNGWAHAPSTRYSMPAIVTGRLPLDVAYDTSLEGWPGLADEAITLAEVLRPLGFLTGAITNYWYFDAHRGMAQGFDEYDNDNARLHSAIPGHGPAATAGSSSRQQTDKALAFVERHAGARWFLWVHYYDPHYEYEAHPEVPPFGENRLDRYDGEIRFTDDQLGRLFEELRRRGLYDKTVIAITGDHGEGFGEHGIELHGYHLYAAQTKVPMIVRAPGLPPRRAVTEAGHIDLLPTLANLLGAPGPGADGRPAPLLSQAMGQSLVDVMAQGAERERTIWQQLSYEGRHELRGAVTRRCHVIYNASPATSWEVYRLDRDPLEQRDLGGSGECADTARALAEQYDTSVAAAGAAILPARPKLEAPLALRLGDAVELLALEVPRRARPGQTLELRWTFEARAPLPPGWKVFLHVEGPAPLRGDHAPPLPFEWWRAGQIVQYTTSLRLPAQAGTYTLWTGLWKGARRMPAQVVAGAPALRIERDRALVATIEVAP